MARRLLYIVLFRLPPSEWRGKGRGAAFTKEAISAASFDASKNDTISLVVWALEHFHVELKDLAMGRINSNNMRTIATEYALHEPTLHCIQEEAATGRVCVAISLVPIANREGRGEADGVWCP
jgi:hypothetical protein